MPTVCLFWDSTNNIIIRRGVPDDEYGEQLIWSSTASASYASDFRGFAEGAECETEQSSAWKALAVDPDSVSVARSAAASQSPVLEPQKPRCKWSLLVRQ